MSARRHRGWLAAAVLCLLALAGCDESSSPTATPEPTAATGTPTASTSNSAANLSRAPLDIEEMVEDADAIVIGTVATELEPSLVPRQPVDGIGTPVAADRFRNFRVEVEESFVPGVEVGDKIGVRVAAGLESLRDNVDLVRLKDLPDIQVGARLLMFLGHLGPDDQQHDSQIAPVGIPVESYYRLADTQIESPPAIVAHYLVPDGDAWLLPQTGSVISQGAVIDAIKAHAHVVPSDCLSFIDYGDYAGVGSLYGLVARSDVVVKGLIEAGRAETGEPTYSRSSSFDVQVSDVIVGHIDTTPITVANFWGQKRPRFESCEYYLFLDPYAGRLGDGPQDSYQMSAGGAQGIFAVYNGVVEQVSPILTQNRYRGMSEAEFVAEILEAAAWAEERND